MELNFLKIQNISKNLNGVRDTFEGCLKNFARNDTGVDSGGN